MLTEEAFQIADEAVVAKTGKALTDIQRMILRESLADKGYEHMQGYDHQHIKNEGSKLWSLLSDALNEKVSKKNFRGALEKRLKSLKLNLDWQNLCRKMLDRQKSLSTNEIIASEPLQFDLTSDDIYVSLALVERKEPPTYPSDINPEQGLQQQEQPPIEYEQFQEEVLRLGKGKSRGQRIAIVGEPGAGKTTLLQKTAFWILEKQLGFPIWISLGDLALDSNQLQRLKTYIFSEWLRDTDFNVTDDVISDFERHIKGTTVWLLLDGVDEVSQSSSSLKEIADQLRGWLSESRIILSCRQNLWEMQPNALQDFETYRVKEFTYPDKVQRFITNGFRRNNLSSGERLIAELGRSERTRLRSLVQNPLRLMLLCSAWHEGLETLPETKAELFAMFVEKSYKWKKSRWQQESWYQKSLKTKKQREALNLALGNLAIRALDQEFEDKFSHNSFFRLSYDLVENVLGDPEDEDTPSFFWLALKLNWLLEARKAENPREMVYVFAHPTFQEYFAALAIEDWDDFLPRKHIDKPTKNRKGKCEYRIFEPQWKEVIILWLGRYSISRSLKEQAFFKLLSFQDNCGNFYFFKARFLAAEFIQEFRDYSDLETEKVISEIVKYSFGYFDEGRRKWCSYLTPISWGARRIVRNSLEAQITKNHLLELIDICPDSSVRWHIANTLDIVGISNERIKKILIAGVSSKLKPYMAESLKKLIVKIKTARNNDLLSQGNKRALTTENHKSQVFEDSLYSKAEIDELIQQIKTSEDWSIVVKVVEDFQKIIETPQLITIVKDLKLYLLDLQDYLIDELENKHFRYEYIYAIVWHCAQNMDYPVFYQAWQNFQYTLNNTQFSKPDRHD